MPDDQRRALADVFRDIVKITLRARSTPVSTNTTGTAVLGDRAECVPLSAGLTIPANLFGPGNWFEVYNDTAGALTITQGASLTLRLAGTASTGNRTLAQRGFARVWFRSATEAIISGNGVT